MRPGYKTTLTQLPETPTFVVEATTFVTLRAEHVAQAFAAFDADQQAAVFALVASIAAEWSDAGADTQWLHVANSLTPKGAEMLRRILNFYDERVVIAPVVGSTP